MFMKEPIHPEHFVGKYTKFRRSIPKYGGCEVYIRDIKKVSNPQFGDIRDYTGVGDVRIIEDDIIKKMPCNFNLGWIIIPR